MNVDIDVEVCERLGYQFLPDGRLVNPSHDWMKPHECGLIIEAPPPFTRDLNYAFILTRHQPCNFSLNIRAVGGWYACFSESTKSNAGAWGEGMVDDDQAALAICYAWLAWQVNIEKG